MNLCLLAFITPWNGCSGWPCYAGHSVECLAGHHISCLSYIGQVDVKMFVVRAGWCPQFTSEHCEVLFLHKCSCFFSKKPQPIWALYQRYKHLCLHVAAWLLQFCQQKVCWPYKLTNDDPPNKSLTAHTFQGMLYVFVKVLFFFFFRWITLRTT